MAKNVISTDNMAVVGKMQALINQMLRPNVKEYSQEITTVEDGTVTEYTRVVTLAHAKKDKPTLTIKDPSLLRALAVYDSSLQGDRIMSYAKCKAVSMMKDRIETINNHGYKTVGDFVYALYGVKSTTANKWVRVGQAWINDDLTLNEFPQGTPVSTMMEVLPFVSDDNGKVIPGKVASFYREGILVDGMSQNAVEGKLKEVCKGILPSPKDDKRKKSNKANTTDSANTIDKTNTNNNATATDNVNTFDNIKSMTAIQSSATILSCCETIDAIVREKVSDNETMENALQLIEVLRNLARAIASNDSDSDSDSDSDNDSNK